MRNPKFIKGLFILPLYPILYYCWVEQMKNSWIENDIKDLHPEILFPEKDRYTLKYSPYKIQDEYEDCHKTQIKGLRYQYEKRINKNK